MGCMLSLMTVRATGMQAVLNSFSRALTRLERGDRSVNGYDYEVNEDHYPEDQQQSGKWLVGVHFLHNFACIDTPH
jgi:hypothetical protein